MAEIFFICLLLGSVVGVLAGMLGIGGGLIIVPALLYLLSHTLNVPLDLAMPMAIATSLASIIVTGLSSALAHKKLGHLRSDLVGWCAIGIAAGAIVGAQVASILPGDAVKDVFGFFVLFIALHMFFTPKPKSNQQATPLILVVIGLFAGALSAFMGIGGGAILVPALLWFRVDMKVAIGCAALCGLVIALFGTASFVVAGWSVAELPKGAVGYVYVPAVIGIVLTSVFTAKTGAKISHRLNTVLLKRIFATFLIVVGGRMLVG